MTMDDWDTPSGIARRGADGLLPFQSRVFGGRFVERITRSRSRPFPHQEATARVGYAAVWWRVQ